MGADGAAALALRLQAFLRAVAAPGRDVVRVPPFTAYLDPRARLRYLSYAIPDDGAEPEGAAVAALRAAFQARARLPRLEWVEEAAPAVTAALAAGGLVEELRTPLMACAPAELVEPEVAVGALAVLAVSAADLRAYRDVQLVAFGDPPLAVDEEPRPIRGSGVLARVAGELVATAGRTEVVDGVSEIAGVATAELWRGRGLAGAVTAAAAREAFAAGAELCVLSPGSEAAQRVYERAGFRRVATMLHWADPG